MSFERYYVSMSAVISKGHGVFEHQYGVRDSALSHSFVPDSMSSEKIDAERLCAKLNLGEKQRLETGNGND